MRECARRGGKLPRTRGRNRSTYFDAAAENTQLRVFISPLEDVIVNKAAHGFCAPSLWGSLRERVRPEK